jgi:hypothetical protein
VTDEHAFYTTVRWLDRHGVNRSADVLTEPGPDARVWAYANNDDGSRTLIGAMHSDGKFFRLSAANAGGYGMDTAAAWNNLIEVCRRAHIRSNPYPK